MGERETHHKANIFVEPDLWRAVKIRAAERGVTATAILNEALRAYFAGPAARVRRKAKGA